MSNLFSRARDWLPGKVQAAAGVAVTYTRGATSLSLTAVVGNTLFAAAAEPGGARVLWGERDYLVIADDLTLGVPAEGDRIAEVIDGTTVTFEVMPTDTGEPAFRYSDPQRTVWRLHCKKVA